MKKLIICVVICLGALVSYLAYSFINNPMDTLNYATWDKVPEETRTQFADFFSGDTEQGEEFYRMYFLKFNPVHEASHALREKYEVKTELYEEEQSVNDIAVAYWREVGEEEFINDLEKVVREVLSNMESPVPEGQDVGQYFNENYHNLGDDPNLYGYFQFTFVLNAIEKKESLYTALSKNIGNVATERNGDLSFDKIDVATAEPQTAIQNFSEYLKLYNIEVPEIKYNNKFRATIQSID